MESCQRERVGVTVGTRTKASSSRSEVVMRLHVDVFAIDEKDQEGGYQDGRIETHQGLDRRRKGEGEAGWRNGMKSVDEKNAG